MTNFNKYSKDHIHFYGESAPILLIDLISRVNPKSLADFGCGDGAILFDLQRKCLLRRIDYVTAIDLSETRLERVKKYTVNVKTICSDVCGVKQLKDGQLDLVMCTQVIEHVESDEKLLKEIYRVLKPGGYLYISSVVKKWYDRWIYRCNGKVTCDPTHLREYKSIEEFNQLIKNNKFKIEKTRIYQFKPSLMNTFKRILIKYRIISEDNARNSKILSFFSNLKIPAPGYFIVESLSTK